MNWNKKESKMELTIKEIRERSGLSRSEICELLDVPYRTLQNWELGERIPPEYLVALIDFRVRHRELD